MEELRISLMTDDEYETFVIQDGEEFLDKLRADPKIGTKYKKMDIKKFREWMEEGLTPRQFKTLRRIHETGSVENE